MPLHNWIKCTGGDLRYARKEVDEATEETEEDAEAWARIYDSYLTKYGLNKLYLKLLKTMQKKALLELEYVTTRKRFKLTEIALEAEKLKTLLNNNNTGLTIEESLIYLSKWLGYHLSVKKTTVNEYFTLLNEYGKANKKK